MYGIFACIARTIWIKRNTLLQIANPNFNMARCYLFLFTSHQSKLSPPPPKKRINLPKQSGPPKDTTAIKHHHRRKSENGTFSRYLCTKSRIAAPLEAAASLFSKVFTWNVAEGIPFWKVEGQRDVRETEKDARGKGDRRKSHTSAWLKSCTSSFFCPRSENLPFFLFGCESCRAYYWLEYPLDLSQFRPFTNP